MVVMPKRPIKPGSEDTLDGSTWTAARKVNLKIYSRLIRNNVMNLETPPLSVWKSRTFSRINIITGNNKECKIHPTSISVWFILHYRQGVKKQHQTLMCVRFPRFSSTFFIQKLVFGIFNNQCSSTQDFFLKKFRFWLAPSRCDITLVIFY